MNTIFDSQKYMLKQIPKVNNTEKSCEIRSFLYLESLIGKAKIRHMTQLTYTTKK